MSIDVIFYRDSEFATLVVIAFVVFELFKIF